MKFPHVSTTLIGLTLLSGACQPLPLSNVAHSLSEVQRLPCTSAECSAGSWSPDSAKIVFLDNVQGILIGDAFLADSQPLFKNQELDGLGVYDPYWSPDGQSIALELIPKAKSQSKIEQGVYLVNPDGNNLKLVAATSGLATALLGWSPDGKRLLISQPSEDDGVWLATIDVQSGQIEPVRRFDWVWDAAWSSTGEVAVVGEDVRESTGDRTLFTFSIGADELRQPLADESLDVYSVDWSFDGQRLIFTTTGDMIYIMNVDGTERQLLFDEPLHAWSFAWSPDEQWLLLTAKGWADPDVTPTTYLGKVRMAP